MYRKMTLLDQELKNGNNQLHLFCEKYLNNKTILIIRKELTLKQLIKFSPNILQKNNDNQTPLQYAEKILQNYEKATSEEHYKFIQLLGIFDEILQNEIKEACEKEKPDLTFILELTINGLDIAKIRPEKQKSWFSILSEKYASQNSEEWKNFCKTIVPHRLLRSCIDDESSFKNFDALAQEYPKEFKETLLQPYCDHAPVYWLMQTKKTVSEFLKFMIEKEPEILQLKFKDQSTLWHQFFRKQPYETELFHFLLHKSEPDLSAKYNDGNTLLHYAFSNPSVRLDDIKTLVKDKEIAFVNNKGETLWHAYCCYNMLETDFFEYLLEKVKLDSIDNDGFSFFHCVFLNKYLTMENLKILMKLLSSKIELTLLTNNKTSALHMYSCSGSLKPEIVSYLLDNKLNPMAKNNDGISPLHYACVNNNCNLESIKLMIEAMKNFPINNNEFNKILDDCINKKKEYLHYFESKKIIKSNQVQNNRDEKGNSSFHIICSEYVKNDRILKSTVENYLKELNYDPLLKNNDGQTPLQYTQQILIESHFEFPREYRLLNIARLIGSSLKEKIKEECNKEKPILSFIIECILNGFDIDDISEENGKSWFNILSEKCKNFEDWEEFIHSVVQNRLFKYCTSNTSSSFNDIQKLKHMWPEKFQQALEKLYWGLSFVHWFIRQREGNIEILKFLAFENKKILFQLDNNNSSLLLVACQANCAKKNIIRYLLDENLNPSQKNISGNTPLHYSFSNSNIDFAINEYLVKKCNELTSIHNKAGVAVLHQACERQNYDMQLLDLLLKIDNKSINQKDIFGKTPLHYAFANKFFELDGIKKLVKAGAKLTLVDNEENSLLHIHCNSNTLKPEFLSYLIEKKLSPIMVNSDKKTSLYLACVNPNFNLESIEILMTATENLGSKKKLAKSTDSGFITSHFSIKKILQDCCWFVFTNEHATEEALLYFLNKKPNLDEVNEAKKNKNKEYTLRSLLQKHHPNIFKIMEINKQDKEGNTNLLRAVTKGNIKDIERLLKEKANPNIQNNKNQTPLHCAVLQKNSDIIKILLENKANPNVQDNNGKTPWHYFHQIWENNTERNDINNLFIEYGAKDLKDSLGKLPKDYNSQTNEKPVKKNTPKVPIKKQNPNANDKNKSKEALKKANSLSKKNNLNKQPEKKTPENKNNQKKQKANLNNNNKIENNNLSSKIENTQPQEINQVNIAPLQSNETEISIDKNNISIQPETPKIYFFNSNSRYLTFSHSMSQLFKSSLPERLNDDINHKQDENGNTELHILCRDPIVNFEQIRSLVLEKNADPTLKNNSGVSAISIIEEKLEEINKIIDKKNNELKLWCEKQVTDVSLLPVNLISQQLQLFHSNATNIIEKIGEHGASKNEESSIMASMNNLTNMTLIQLEKSLKLLSQSVSNPFNDPNNLKFEEMLNLDTKNSDTLTELLNLFNQVKGKQEINPLGNYNNSK